MCFKVKYCVQMVMLGPYADFMNMMMNCKFNKHSKYIDHLQN
jgi:hypothetical protein